MTITATGADNASDINIVAQMFPANKAHASSLMMKLISWQPNKPTKNAAIINQAVGMPGIGELRFRRLCLWRDRGGNDGKGYGNGDETTWRTSHIGDKASDTVMVSGGNTTVKGAQVLGKSIISDVENLTIGKRAGHNELYRQTEEYQWASDSGLWCFCFS